MLRTSFFILITTTIAIILSYYFIDRAVAIWIYQQSWVQHSFLHSLTRLPEIFTFFAVLYYFYYVLRFSMGIPAEIEKKLLIATNALVIVVLFKNVLKFCFGRAWILPWLHDNPSLIGDQTYGFFWFHGGQAYASFPSGHTAVTVAVATVLWLSYPALRWLYLLSSVCVAVALVGMNFHFISDVIAGAGLGVLVGYWTYSISSNKS